MQLTNVLVSLAAAAGCATAAVVKIAVGERGGLTYTPDTVKADIGDVLEFHFVGGTHDAVLGDFDNPCKPATPAGTGFASGVIQGSTTNTRVFKVTVNTTEPQFYYCSVGMHCANGMVGVVNPAPGGKTAADFKAAARGKTATRPSGVYGGTF